MERDSLHPFIKDVRGVKFALLNYTYGTNGIDIPSPYIVNLIDTTQIKKDLAVAKSRGADLNLVCIHWGLEYTTRPSREQKQLTKWLFANGADHIIGGHPHVIQPIESFVDTISGKKQTVAYSLGNFISNMSVKRTDGGMLFKMRFYKNEGKWDSDSSYSLVWVARPNLSGEKNYALYPVSLQKPEIKKPALNKLNIFEKEADRVMQKNSVDVKKWEM